MPRAHRESHRAAATYRSGSARPAWIPFPGADFPDRNEPDRTAFDRGRNPILERRPIALHEDVDAGPFLSHSDPGPDDAGQVHPGRRPPRQHLLDHGRVTVIDLLLLLLSPSGS